MEKFKERLTEMSVAMEELRNKKKRKEAEAMSIFDPRPSPSPEAAALAEVSADQLQEWLPGYLILIAGDGQVKIQFVERQDRKTIANVAYVNQVFEIVKDGSAKRYRVSVTVRDEPE